MVKAKTILNPNFPVIIPMINGHDYAFPISFSYKKQKGENRSNQILNFEEKNPRFGFYQLRILKGL